ncbi:hypothetical protein HHI36_000337, partial [Cryptolaemus montrouzieri]
GDNVHLVPDDIGGKLCSIWPEKHITLRPILVIFKGYWEKCLNNLNIRYDEEICRLLNDEDDGYLSKGDLGREIDIVSEDEGEVRLVDSEAEHRADTESS